MGRGPLAVRVITNHAAVSCVIMSHLLPDGEGSRGWWGPWSEPHRAETTGRSRDRRTAPAGLFCFVRCAPDGRPSKGPRSRGRTPPTSFPGALPGRAAALPADGPPRCGGGPGPVYAWGAYSSPSAHPACCLLRGATVATAPLCTLPRPGAPPSRGACPKIWDKNNNSPGW